MTEASTVPASTPTGGARVERPLRSRYVVVVLLVLGALVAFGTNVFIVSGAIDATAKSFARSSIPGTITTDLHPGTWNVWLEGPGTIDTVTVTDASGRAFDVRMGGGGTSYNRSGFTASKVASFEVPRGGMVTKARVTASGTSGTPESAFAVGPADEFGYTDIAKYGSIVVIVIDLVAIALIVAVPIIRHRRRA